MIIRYLIIDSMPYKDPEKQRAYNEKRRQTLEHKEYQKKYHKEWREKNKEKKKQIDKEYREKNKEKLKDQKKEYYEKNLDKITNHYKTPECRKIARISKWRRRGVICDDFDELYERYLNTELCELCNCELTIGKRTKTTKCLDHDHETGKFRNILCHSCNIKRR